MSSYATVCKEIDDYLSANHRVALESIAPEATLEDIGIDSLGVLELVTLLENKFGITFELGQMTQLRTFSDLMELVKEKSARLA